MVVAYATRNPLGICALENKTRERFEKVLNIPLTNKEGDVRDTQEQETPEGAKKTADPRWQDQLDLTQADDQELRGKIIKMLEKHEDMWRPGKLGTVDATYRYVTCRHISSCFSSILIIFRWYHRIELEPGTKPIRQAPYRQGHKGRDIQPQEITKMLNAGVIEPTTSEWASPVVLLLKKDDSLRFCIDYRGFNAETVPEAYPLHYLTHMDAAVFTTLDCNSGYWQVPITPEDRDKTTFTTHLGSLRHLQMPLGLKNAPATFQRALDIILSGVC